MQEIRTSISHPLRIDEIVLSESGARIGLTLCPGKCCNSYYGYDWQRDIDIDMQAVRGWGADILVTLMEVDEMDSCQVSTIGDICAKRDIEWYHLPIRDVDIPDQQFERIWTYAGARLNHALNNGKRVLLHCRGGLGRTGTIAARLLVELGWDSLEAIDTIRNKRPGAIETDAQEAYARSCFSMKKYKYEHLSRLMGCLFGGAIGDGLGYLVEFDSLEGIRRSYGQKGVSNPVYGDRITVSDDTQMTLFSMEGLLRAQGCSHDTVIAEVRKAYLDWYKTQRNSVGRETVYGSLAFSSSLQVRRAPGNTCLGALAEGGSGTLNATINDSKGCGSVMRVAPVGLITGNFGKRAILELGMRTGALTHGHMTSSLSAGVMACMISGLMAGKDLQTVARSTHEMLQEYQGHEETSLAMIKALDAARSNPDDHSTVIKDLWGDPNLSDSTSRGWVAEEALAIGLYSALRGKDYEEVIQIAANHNGDSDSTASIAGQLYGAWKGVDAVPHNWISKLDVFDEIVSLISDAGKDNSIGQGS